MTVTARVWALHLGLIAVLFALHFVLPAYHHGNLARIMVLATYAIGYNVLFGYTGLLSLGHALFFAAGMYGMGLAVSHAGLSPAVALCVGVLAGALVSFALALLALRTSGVAFMIVTLMFAQAGYLTILYFGEWTRGDEGFVIQAADRVLWGFDLSDPANRYFAALTLFAVCLLVSLRLVRRPFGRTLIAIRENEERVRMLGYDTWAHKMGAMVISGTISAAGDRAASSETAPGTARNAAASTATVRSPPRSAGTDGCASGRRVSSGRRSRNCHPWGGRVRAA